MPPGVEFFPSYLLKGTLLHLKMGTLADKSCRTSFEGQFCHRLPILSRVRGPVIHARRRISHNRLAPTHAAGIWTLQVNFVTFIRQFTSHVLSKAILHHHVTAAERMLAEPRRLQSRL